MKSFNILILSLFLLISCNDNNNGGENPGTDQPFPQTLPSSFRVVVFATECALPTSCSSSYIDQAAADVVALNPDIVIATEFFWKKGNYTDFAKKVGLSYHVRGPGNNQDQVTGGVVILSRYPFSEVHKQEFSSAILPDNLVKKGTVLGRLKLGLTESSQEVYLSVAGTHYQSKSVGDFAQTQNDQVKQQADFILNKVSENDLMIHGGDFNFTQDVPSWLCSDDSCVEQIKENYADLASELLVPRGFISSSQVCSSGACEDTLLAEQGEQRSAVTKLFVTNKESAQGVRVVPRAFRSTQTISDHRTWIADFELISN